MFALIFMISFLLVTSGFICSSFSSCSRSKVRVFTWDFFCLRIEVLYISLRSAICVSPGVLDHCVPAFKEACSLVGRQTNIEAITEQGEIEAWGPNTIPQ